MTEEEVMATGDPAMIAAWLLLEAHENATRDGYSVASYPAEHIDNLARAMHSVRGLTAHCDNHTRARDLWIARHLLQPLRRPDNAIWRIEVLETNWRHSYCGIWMQNAEITGPPGDDETAILKRACDLADEGHIVQVVCEQPVRTVVWQGKLPWSGTRIGQTADAMLDGTWRLEPGTVLHDLDALDQAPPTPADQQTRRKLAAVIPTAPSTTPSFTDGTRVYHLRRRQWGIVDGPPQHPTSTWVRFDGEDDSVEASNEFLSLTQPVPGRQ